MSHFFFQKNVPFYSAIAAYLPMPGIELFEKSFPNEERWRRG